MTREFARNALKQSLMRKPLNLYSEFQLPPVWHAFLALLVTSSLGIAYGSAVSLLWGWLVGIGLSALGILWWFKKGIRITITTDSLQVGNFEISRSHVGAIAALDQVEFLERIRGGAHRQDVFVLRNLKNGGVEVEINDKRDPFCHWVVTSRNPSKIKRVLEGSSSDV